MEIVNLGGSGLKVSRVCLGTMTFGGQLNETDSIRVVKQAIDLGVNFFDTADIYTGGTSETITGKALKDCRDKVVIASKVCGPSEKGPNGSGLGRKHVLASINNSLRRLGTDYLDVYYMHMPDPSTPLEETLEVMTDLVRAGKVRYIGMSNFAAWQMTDALWLSDRKNLIAPVVTESVYNPITRGIELELVSFLKAKKLGMTVYNPLAGGLLSGKHGKEGPLANTRLSEKGYNMRYWNNDSLNALDRLTEVAQAHGMTLLELSLRWCVSYDYVSSIITGVSKPEHLIQNLALLEKGPLTSDILAECDEVWKLLSGNRFAYNR